VTKARFPALRNKRNVRKKWPMTWLEFVTWYGLRQIRTWFTLCSLTSRSPNQ